MARVTLLRFCSSALLGCFLGLGACYPDLSVDEDAHPCSECRACEVCALEDGEFACLPDPVGERLACHEGDVVRMDACGEQLDVVEACPDHARCDAAQLACLCEERWFGASCDMCPPGFDPEKNCAECRNRWSGDDCRMCPGHFDPAQDCGACKPPWKGDACDVCPLGYAPSGDSCVERCGDGIVTEGELCDDANQVEDDGCHQCRVPPIEVAKAGRAPRVAAGFDGRFVVVWETSRYADGQVFTRLFAADGSPLTDALAVSPEADQHQPRVGMRADGGFVVAWWDGPDASDRILVRIYDPFGDPLGEPMVVFQSAAGAPLLAVASDGRFAVGQENVHQMSTFSSTGEQLTTTDLLSFVGFVPSAMVWDPVADQPVTVGIELSGVVLEPRGELIGYGVGKPLLAVDDEGWLAVAWEPREDGPRAWFDGEVYPSLPGVADLDAQVALDVLRQPRRVAVVSATGAHGVSLSTFEPARPVPTLVQRRLAETGSLPSIAARPNGGAVVVYLAAGIHAFVLEEDLRPIAPPFGGESATDNL